MKKITILDVICVIAVVCFCVWIVFHSVAGISDCSVLHIDSPDGMYEYQTDKNQTLRIQGRLGITTVEIRDRHFWFVDSPCLNKTCIHCGKIRRANIPVVCLPNGVSAYIVGKSDIDDISR